MVQVSISVLIVRVTRSSSAFSLLTPPEGDYKRRKHSILGIEQLTNRHGNNGNRAAPTRTTRLSLSWWADQRAASPPSCRREPGSGMRPQREIAIVFASMRLHGTLHISWQGIFTAVRQPATAAAVPTGDQVVFCGMACCSPQRK